MERHHRNYVARKAWDEAERCLKILTFNFETVSGQIRSGMNRVPSIQNWATRAELGVKFDERGVFKDIDIISSVKNHPYPFKDSSKINEAHLKKKHQMLDELVVYCTGIIAAAAKVHAS